MYLKNLEVLVMVKYRIEMRVHDNGYTYVTVDDADINEKSKFEEKQGYDLYVDVFETKADVKEFVLDNSLIEDTDFLNETDIVFS